MATKTGTVDFTASNYGGTQTLRVHWQETVNLAAGAKSTVAITKVELASNAWLGTTYYADFTLKINGQEAFSTEGNWSAYLSAADTFKEIKRGENSASGSVPDIGHNADGTKSVSITLHKHDWAYPGASGEFWEGGMNPYQVYKQYKFTDGDSKSITLTKIPVGTLTISAGTGSSVSVTRGGTALENGAALYSGDVLTVAATAASGYAYPTYTTSGGTRSGNTVTVGNGGVTVTSSATRAYTLTRLERAGTTLTTKVTASPVRSVPVTISGSSGTVYAGETVSVSAALTTGYTNLRLLRSGSAISNPYTWTVDTSRTFSTLADLLSYGLTRSVATGATLVTLRTSSPIGGGALEDLGNGAEIYTNDVLQITATAADGYRITGLTVNGNAFTSGGNHTVTGNVTVAVTTEAYGASDFTVSGSTMGISTTITIQKANSSFTSTLRYRFSGDTDTEANWKLIATEKFSSTAVSWTPDASTLGPKIPAATSGVWKLRLTTYNGSTEIGTTIHDVTLNIPSDAKPRTESGWNTVSISDASASVQAPVKGFSRIMWTLDTTKITTRYGASLTSVTASCGESSVTKTASGTYEVCIAPEVTNVVTIYATDSRGLRSSVWTYTRTAYDYAQPLLSDITVFRCDTNMDPADDGGFIYVKATGSVSDAGGENTLTLKGRVKTVDGASTLLSAYLTSGTASKLGGSYSSSTSYLVEVEASDELGGLTVARFIVPTATVAFNLMDGGEGGAFGKHAEASDLLDVAWSERVRQNLTVDGTLTVDGKPMNLYILTGTLPSSASYSSAISYPTGLTRDNCQIVAFEVYHGSMWKFGDGLASAGCRTFAALRSSDVRAYNDDSNLYGCSFRITLRKL